MRSILPLALLLALRAFPQVGEDTTLVRYHGGMDLREGIYADLASFRNNRPTYPLERLMTAQGAPVQDLRKVGGKLRFRPDTGEVVNVDLDAMWGFCNADVVYIRAGNGFYRIGSMGSLAHVLYEYTYRDWDPYMYPGGSVNRTAQGQFILDMATGRMLDLNASNMEAILQRDPILAEQFAEIPKRKRRAEVLFLYLRRYNDRHPLYFPR